MTKCQSSQNRFVQAVLTAAALAFALTALPGTALADGLTDDQQQQTPVEEQVVPEVQDQEAPASEGGSGQVVTEGADDQAVSPIPVVDEPAVMEPATEEPVIDEPAVAEPAIVPDEETEPIAEPSPEEDGISDPEAMADDGEGEAKVFVRAAPLKSPPPQGPIADGLYVIETAAAANQVVVAKGAGTSDGTNVLTYSYAGSTVNMWLFEYDVAKSAYKISMPGTSKVLAVSGASNNVILWESLDSPGQRWILSGSDIAGWLLASYKDPSLVLDMAGSGTANSTNITAAQSSSSRSSRQHFYLLPDKAAAGTKVVEDGAYEVNAYTASSYVMAMGSSSTAAGASAILYSETRSPGQKWQFTYDGTGYYTIIVLCSGKALAIPSANHIPGADARQYQITNSDAQKWAIYQNSDGSLSIVNKNTGLYLAIAGGKMANSTNVFGWRTTGSSAQRWALTSIDYIEPGYYEVKPIADDGLNLEFSNASATTEASLKADNNALNQRFQVIKVGTNQYKIRTGASGGWLRDTAAGAGVTQPGSSSTEAGAEVWTAVWNGNYYSLLSGSGRVIDLKGSASSGVSTKTSPANAGNTQHFRFVPTNLIDSGLYEIRSQVGTTLAIASGSPDSGANVVSWKILHSPAQKFLIEKRGSGYVITNVYSGMVITPSGSSKCNVDQRNPTSSSRQVWVPEISDGGYLTFKNAETGQMLAIANSNAGSNSNVIMWPTTGSKGQNWRPVATSYRGWLLRSGKRSYMRSDGKTVQFSNAGYAAWKGVQRFTSPTKYIMVIDNSNYRTFVFTGSKGNWEPLYDWLATVGTSPENGGDETFGETYRGENGYVDRKGYMMGECPYEFYWTEFYLNNAAREANPENPEGQRFHSILYWGQSPNSAVYDGTLGAAASHGCVRLATANAKWVYDNIPKGTRVWSY